VGVVPDEEDEDRDRDETEEADSLGHGSPPRRCRATERSPTVTR
jgi:hypothetical protein